MRKKHKALIQYVVLWTIFLPIWVIKRIFYHLRNVIRDSDLVKSDIDRIDSMSGVGFEEFLAVLFKKKGLKVELTSTTGDFGADLILEGDGCRTAVQAKRYSDLVGLDAVQEVLGARDYYRADKLMVITNYYFTNAAKKQAESSNVILWDRGSLIQEIIKGPDKVTPVSEYLLGFFKRSLTDYKLILGLFAVSFVYIPFISSAVSSVGDSNFSTQYSNEITQTSPQNGKTSIQFEKIPDEVSDSPKRPGYIRYRNGRFGYKIDFPKDFVSQNPQENGSGITFLSKDGLTKLTVYGINNTGYKITDAYNTVINQATGPLGYRVLKGTWFVVTWNENGTLYYRKTILGQGSENTFIITFPEYKKDFYNPILENIENYFTHGNTAVAH